MQVDVNHEGSYMPGGAFPHYRHYRYEYIMRSPVSRCFDYFEVEKD